MSIDPESSTCGICGRPLNDEHEGGHLSGAAAKQGKRVVYTVVRLRGATAEYQPLGDPSKTGRTGAADLATMLGADESTLVGRRFSCWVVPAEYGVFKSDFRLA